MSAASAPHLSDGYRAVLEATGYLHDGRPAPGFLEQELLSTAPALLDRRLKYEVLFDSRKLGASAVFEVSGSPCIYFADLHSEPEAAVLGKLHRLAWNHGQAPLLWVITPTRVILYDCFATPSREGDLKQRGALGTFGIDPDGLRELTMQAGRLAVETGAIWRSPFARSIDRGSRVDAILLRDLEAAQERLVHAGLPPDIAQAFIGRSIFVAYLVHRGIIQGEFLRARFGIDSLTDIFASYSKAIDVFGWVRETFNGDLFPDNLAFRLEGTTQVIEARHIEVVRDMLCATDLTSGQTSLWPYDFSVIPVELLSSIYERFAHAEDSSTARLQSTHYTPLNLVDLTLSQTLSGVDANSRVADLTCGSGVFLVEAFRRLVAMRLVKGEALSRSLIRETLREQIFGVDVNKTAVQIAALSLYLTALELDPDPQPAEALRFEHLVGRNLFVADVFNEDDAFTKRAPFSTREIDVVIGNPPWTRGAASRSGIDYCARHELPLARQSIDQAFIWRTQDFLRDGARIGLILSGKPFFSNSTTAKRARSALFVSLAPHLLVDLSELRQKGLFTKAVGPAALFVASKLAPDADRLLTLVHVEDPGTFRKLGILQVNPDQVRRVPVRLLVEDPALMKAAVWSTPRDVFLLRRLRRRFPTLGEWIERRGWKAGQGFQDAAGVSETPAEMRTMPVLPAGELTPYYVHPDRLTRGVPAQLHRPRDPEQYRAPLLITARAVSTRGFVAAFCEHDVLFNDLYFAISAPERDSEPLRYMSAVLNSTLATYILFLSSGAWGVERDEVKPNELLAFPLPSRTEDHTKAIDRIVRLESSMRGLVRTHAEPSEIAAVRNEIDALVFDLYGLRKFERDLVRDFVSVTLERWRGGVRADAEDAVTSHALREYAERIHGSLSSLVATLGERKIVVTLLPSGGGPLEAVAVHIVEPNGASLGSRTYSAGDAVQWRQIQRQLEELLRHDVAHGMYSRRVFRLYRPQQVVVVKPKAMRFWTRAAAIADADAIVGESIGLDVFGQA